MGTAEIYKENTMGKPLKEIYSEQRDLRDKMFLFSLMACIVLVITCAAIMLLEGNSLWTVIFNAGAAFVMLMLFRLAFIKEKKGVARGIFIYFMNIMVLTYLFFINGGVNSGMPIYLVAGLILIVLSEYGVKRYVALVICSLFHVASIFVSYYFMSGEADKVNLPVFVQEMDLFSEVYDTAISLIIVGLCIGVILILVFNAYDQEKNYNEELMNKLADMTITDELTGLSNRRHMFTYLETHDDLFGSSERYLAMFDVDFFKKINDTYGHLFGDEVLSRFGDVLMIHSEEPEVELAARYGGEEFVLLYNASNKEEAMARINRIREQMKSISIKNYPDVKLTVSAGLVCCSKHKNLTSLLKEADDCLYEAKNEGRDRVIAAI